MGFVEHGRLGGAGYEDGPVVVARNVLGAARKWWKCCEAFLKISPDAVVPVLNLLLSAALCLLEGRTTLSLCRSELFLCTPINVLYMLVQLVNATIFLVEMPISIRDVFFQLGESAAKICSLLFQGSEASASCRVRYPCCRSLLGLTTLRLQVIRTMA